jgi:hypothetical protein
MNTPGLLYAILRHEGIEQPHYDLMFQTSPGSMLATWRAPIWRPREPMILARLPDHRQAYLTYEGELSGGRGHVKRVEQGICQVEQTGDFWRIQLRPLPVGELLTLQISEKDGVWRCEIA